MKNITLPILLLMLFLGSNAYAVESFSGYKEFRDTALGRVSVNGPADFKNTKLIAGSVTGDVEFDGLVVEKSLDVTGSVFGLEGTFYKLHVIGPVRLTNTRMEHFEVTGPTILRNSAVTRKATIIGFLKATNTVLEDVEIRANSIILHDCKVGVIRVKKSGSLEQKLVLNNSSAKTVVFESGNGKISVVGNAEITGKVIGAIIVQE